LRAAVVVVGYRLDTIEHTVSSPEALGFDWRAPRARPRHAMTVRRTLLEQVRHAWQE
jgi:hypothetical protein